MRHWNVPLSGAFAGGLGTLAFVCALLLAADSAWADEPRAPAQENPLAEQLAAVPKLALVIGIDSYSKGWPDRKNSVRDAKLVGGEFVRHGYKVAILENPTAQRLRRALKQFMLIDGEHPDSRLFIWYSGHTHTLGGTSYLVPSDSPLPRRESEFVKVALPLDEYADLLRRSTAAQIYTVVDGPVAAIEFDPRASGRREGAPHLPVRQFLSSAAVGQAAADDGSFRRLFLRALAGINRADSNLDKVLTADEMGAYIANRVATLTKNRQTPLYGRMPGREFAGGDFAFRVGASHRLDFLAAIRGHDRLADVAEIEKVLWSSIEDSEDPRKFESFLKVYPDGAFAEKAFARLHEARENTAPSRAVASAPRVPARAQPVRQPREVVAMSVAPPAPKPPGPDDLPRDGVELAQAGTGNPFDAPVYPGLPILSLDRAAVPQAAPPQPPALEIRKVTAMKPIPLEPGGEMAVPATPIPPAAAAPHPPPTAMPATTPPPPPRAIPAAVPAPRPALRAAPVPPPAASGRAVQLGAFRDRATAERALADWKRQVPALFLPELTASIEVADLGARGIFHRVRVKGFPDSPTAGAFCTAFKGAGRDCFPVP